MLRHRLGCAGTWLGRRLAGCPGPRKWSVTTSRREDRVELARDAQERASARPARVVPADPPDETICTALPLGACPLPRPRPRPRGRHACVQRARDFSYTRAFGGADRPSGIIACAWVTSVRPQHEGRPAILPSRTGTPSSSSARSLPALPRGTGQISRMIGRPRER